MSNKFSNNLKQKLKMKQLKIKSFLALLGLIMFANIMATAQPLCPPVSYLTATVNSNNSVTLNWTNPPQSQWGNNIAYFRCTVGGTSYNQYFNYFNYTQSGTHTIPASVFPNGGTFTISLFNGFMDGGQQDVCEGVINSVQVTIPTPPTVNMNRYIELTVTQGDTIRLSFKAEVENTGVMVKSGNDSTIFKAYTGATGSHMIKAGGTRMFVFGNITNFNCGSNSTKITGLDASHNTGLTYLDCAYNDVSTLDVSGLTALEDLYCEDNNLSTLDLTGLTALEYLYCKNNNLSTLDLTGLTALEDLRCYKNNLSSITTSGCISLNYIDCSGNKLSACGLDSLFHQLPRRAEDDKGRILIRGGESYDQPGAFSCRDTIATNRNWRVTDNNTDIANTTYACDYFTLGIEEVITDNISAKVYPNPVSNDLNIECGEKIESLDIYDALGRKVISKENTPKSTAIDVSNLDNGIYILKLRTSKGSGEYKIVVND